MKKKFFLLFLFTLVIGSSFGSHIVGGVINYRYLGNKKYELTFKVYRDCESQTKFDGDPTNNGGGTADFYYTLFESSNIYKSNYALKLISKSQVNFPLDYFNPCLDTTLSCVEEGVYRDTIIVPDSTKSYTVVHQRCCRNSGIDNIQPMPGGGGGGSSMPGFTLYVVIPPTITYQNNSASFKRFPPVFICKDRQFTFDHSATDIDGDVLRYYLVTPLEGGTANSPTVTVASPNKTPVLWESPYNLNDIMGGLVPMNLDSISGLLSCKPTVVGRYVVAVMVKEFRAGICIDSFVRDFQFNVNDCQLPNSDIPYEPGSYDVTTGIADFKTNCSDKTIKFVNNSSNSSKFLWKFGEPSSGTNDTSSLTAPTHTYADTGVYMITMVSYKILSDGTLCSDTVRRRVRIFPTFIAKFNLAALPLFQCQSSPVQFQDGTTGTYGITNKWTWDFGDFKSDTVKNPSHTYNIAGTYQVKLTSQNDKKCKDDTIISIVIYSKPKISANVPAASCVLQNVNLSCNTSIPAPDSIIQHRWKLPSGVLVNSCNANYMPTAGPSFTANLWAISAKGCKDSQDLTIVVNPKPVINAGVDQIICYDKTAQLAAIGGLTYIWSPNLYLSSNTTSNPVSKPNYPDSIQYKVEGTDANGCKNTDSVWIKYFIKPFIDAGVDTSVCLNVANTVNFKPTVQLNGQGSFASVYWTPTLVLSDPNIKNPIAQPLVNTEYIINATDLNGCIVKDTVKVIVLNPNIDIIPTKDTFKCIDQDLFINPKDQGIVSLYQWSPTIWVSNPTIRNPRFYGFDTMDYILFIQNYCYAKYDTFRLNVIPFPNTQMIRRDSICNGQTYQFNLNSLYTYVWSTADITITSKSIHNPSSKPSYTSKYVVTATDNFGCKKIDSSTLIVNYPPNITVIGKKPYLCLGDTLSLKIITSEPSKINWIPSTYVSNDTLYEVLITVPDSRFQYVKAASRPNCFTIDTFFINVQKPILPNVQKQAQLCLNSYTSLYASGGLYYHWWPSWRLNDTISDQPQANPDTNMTYYVDVYNDCFHDTTAVNVKVLALPRLTVSEDTSIYRGQEIELEVATSAGTIEWSPVEFINSNTLIKKITVSPSDTIVYKATVRDENGCVNFDSVYVYVYGKNVLLIPSGFSPNGDGINDFFGVSKLLNMKKLDYLEVYNRWGEKVFSTTDFKQFWDGTYKGNHVPSGSYNWQIKVTTMDHESISKSGSIEILR